MSKSLVIITYNFKYEPFLDCECRFHRKFDMIYIFELCPSAESYVEDKYSNTKIFHGFFLSVGKGERLIRGVCNLDSWKELIHCLKRKKLCMAVIKEIFSFSGEGRTYVKIINQLLKEKGINNNSDILIYSYWMGIQAYMAVQMKKNFLNCKSISRGHGIDIYAERNSIGYLPLREVILEGMNRIFCISKDGQEYLQTRYSKYKDKIIVSYLGCDCENRRFTEISDNRCDGFKIVTCSSLIEVKRVHKVIEALSLINSINIEWTHYGSGSLEDLLEQMCKKYLPSNIRWKFRGNIHNDKIQDDYFAGQYHLFINSSESEGIPVSIMEAAAAGIPIIATDVGGTSEIVINQVSGYLIDKDFEAGDLARMIEDIYHMNQQDYFNLRNSTRDFWEKHFNAKKNFDEFSETILNL